MRIFHLADLHLGKSLYEHDLLEDQRHALASVVASAELEQPACVVISGDVFDRAVPPAEAVTLFGRFVADLRAVGSRPDLVIIPGNHDSAARLAFMSLVLATAGVHVPADVESCDRPVIVERDGERARFWLVPFLTPGAFSSTMDGNAQDTQPSHGTPNEKLAGDAGQGEPFADDDAGLHPSLRSQADLFSEAVRRIGAAMAGSRSDGIPTTDVLVCHAFTQGGEESESERVFLGNAERVDSGVFKAFDYVALGHLHRPQAVGAKGRYPGSLLAYSFAEAGKERGFLSVRLSPGSSEAEFCPITPLRRMVRIQGRFDAVLSDPGLSAFEADYIEAVLDDVSTILNPMDALRRRFPWILALRQSSFGHQPSGAARGYNNDTGGSSVTDDFLAFYRELRGADPGKEELELFGELAREADRAAP